jgi:hypothetical protein
MAAAAAKATKAPSLSWTHDMVNLLLDVFERLVAVSTMHAAAYYGHWLTADTRE